MSLITRQYGPNAKGSKLTNLDMDDNLYYLQTLGVSGLTFSSSTLTLTNPTGGTKTVTINDNYTTGATYSNGLIYFNRNDQLSAYTVNISSLTGDTNTFITAFTYTSSANTLTLTDNINNSFNAYINSVSGLTVNGSLSATTISGATFYGDGSNLTGIGSTYNVYSILLSYNGTFSVNQLQNTIGDGSNTDPNDIEWTNPFNGVLNATKTGAFTSSKIFALPPSLNTSGVPYFVTGKKATPNIIQFQIVKYDGTQTSTPFFTDLPVEIRIYN